MAVETQTKHTPGPWYANWHGGDRRLASKIITETGYRIAKVVKVVPTTQEEFVANARLIADSPDMHDQLIALCRLDWAVERRSLYDEEGVEGWAWVEPNGTEHVGIGAWDELPPWPDSARVAIAKAECE